MNRSLLAFWSSLPARVRKWVVWAAGLLGFYTLFGFLILPPIVRMIAVKQLSKQFDRPASIRRILINPFVLSMTIRGLQIQDKDGEPFIAWDEVYANFQLSSFFRKPWVFKEIHVTGPFARLQINKDRSLNCADLVRKFSSEAPGPKAPGKPLLVEIARFHISGARASLTDLTSRTPFHRVVGPLEITLTQFHTDPNSRNPYAFSGTTDSGEEFSWGGFFSLDPIRSAGDLSLKGLNLVKYAPLYQDLMRFQIRDGLVSMHSSYTLALTSSNWVGSVSNAAFSLEGLKVGEGDSTQNVLELDSASLDGMAANTALNTAEVDGIAVNGMRLAARREPQGTLNVLELAQPTQDSTNVPGGLLFLLEAATNAFNLLLSTTNTWSATLHRLDVTNCAIHWEDLANARPVHLALDDISVTGRHLSNLPGSNQTASVSLRWNTNGSVGLDASVQILPPQAGLDLSVHDLDLRPLDPYLAPFVNVFIVRSKVNVDGHLDVHIPSNSLPEAVFSGNAQLDDFATVDGVKSEDLASWKSLQISGIQANLRPASVDVKQILFIEPQARVGLESDGELNIFTLLHAGPSSNSVGAPVAAKTEAPAGTTKKRLGQQLSSVLRGVLESGTNTSGGVETPKLSVQTLVLSNATIHLMDRSVQPPVSASIEDLQGTIANISSEELRRADLNLKGRIGQAGPFEVTGKVNPLSRNAPTELKVNFHSVDLSPASPYAGKFLGYRLNRGGLDLDVEYQISERKLKAKNLVVLDQFTLGEKVQSADATKLPVRLAVALLKDRSGKIELDVPIEGNLDDPQFHFGKVILHVIGNIITKLVTSPFAALGALFGGKGEEVSFLDFPPGTAEVRDAGTEKLQTLIHGLNERPGLQLAIEGSYDPVADRDQIRRQDLDRALRTRKWASLRKGEQARLSPDEVTLTADERSEYLLELSAAIARTNLAQKAAVHTAPVPRESPPAARGTDIAKGATALMTASPQPQSGAALTEAEAAVLASITVTDAELQELASRRAQAVQQKVLESGKLEKERVVLADPSASPPTNQAARVFFHLQ